MKLRVIAINVLQNMQGVCIRMAVNYITIVSLNKNHRKTQEAYALPTKLLPHKKLLKSTIII